MQALRQAPLGWCCSGATVRHPRHHIRELPPPNPPPPGCRRSPKLQLHSVTVTCLFQNKEPHGAGASCRRLPTLCARLRSRALEKRVTVRALTGAQAPRHGKRCVQFKLTGVHVDVANLSNSNLAIMCAVME